MMIEIERGLMTMEFLSVYMIHSVHCEGFVRH